MPTVVASLLLIFYFPTESVWKRTTFVLKGPSQYFYHSIKRVPYQHLIKGACLFGVLPLTPLGLIASRASGVRTITLGAKKRAPVLLPHLGHT